MVEQLISRLHQCQDAIKICYQGSEVIEEKLSSDEIINYVENLLSDEGIISLDKNNLAILTQYKEVKIRFIKLAQATFDERIIDVFNGLKTMDCAVVDIVPSSVFSLQDYHRISEVIEQYCDENATLCLGMRRETGNDQLCLFIFAGYGVIDNKAIEPIVSDTLIENVESDDLLIEKFVEELRQNPTLTISSLQRQYSIGFNRAARHLEIAKSRLQQKGE